MIVGVNSNMALVSALALAHAHALTRATILGTLCMNNKTKPLRNSLFTYYIIVL